MKWEFLREEEFKDAVAISGGLCVLPLGCLEKHGQHLPSGTDSLKAIGITEEAAEIEDVMIFPTGMWLGEVSGARQGKNPIESGNAGFIALKQETILNIMEELCDEIYRNGFRKILFINSHGGNRNLLQHFLRCQGASGKPYATMVTEVRCPLVYHPDELYAHIVEHRDEYSELTDSDMKVLKDWADVGTWGGGHADFSESASVMGYFPELVATDRLDAEDGSSTHRADYLQKAGVYITNSWSANYPNSLMGLPSHGVSQNIGRVMNTICARELAKIFKMLKYDEECVNIATRRKNND